MQKQRKLRPVRLPDLLRQIILAWLLAVTAEYLRLPPGLRSLETLEGLAGMSAGRVAAVGACAWAVLFLLARFWNTARAERWALAAVFAILAAAALWTAFNWALLVSCGLVLAVLVCYACRGWRSDAGRQPVRTEGSHGYLWVTAVLSGLFFLFVSLWTVCRVTTFSTPTYDFGIFSQMLYNMKETGLPMTTLERDGLLSHFAVHVSPIWYLLLPFYCLAPTPATLQVLQAAVITSSVIPLWRIGGRHGLSPGQRTLLCGLLLLLPAFSGGVGYDIHENCFLTPLILWLFYGIDTKKLPLTVIVAVLTLLVKEDAAVYVAVIGLWLLIQSALRLDKWGLAVGAGLLAGALGWFVSVTDYLAAEGDGVMTWRYENFMYDSSGSLLTVVKAVLLHPVRALQECIGPEKLDYISKTMLPLLFLPLLTRRYERYILLIPYVLVNLMPDYTYQHQIFFQYSFGSTACLVYLTAVNLADMRIDRRRSLAAATAVAVSAGCFGAVVVPTAMYYPYAAVKYSAHYRDVRQLLSAIPEDASVAATTFYTTYLSQRAVLYDVRYASRDHVLSAEYVVLAVNATGDYSRYHSAGQKNGYDNLVKLLEQNDYALFAQLEGTAVIFRKV